MLKVGIIGGGFGLYGLLPAFHATKNCQIVSICGEKTERLLKYCKSIGLKKIYSDWRQMLNKENLDAVAIAVPPYIQYQIAKTAIDKGLHIFAEKPLALNVKEARALYIQATKKKIIHTVDFIFPEIEAWKRVKKILDKKRYGALKHIMVNWDFLSYDIKHHRSSWKTDASKGGGALSFYFSHVFYYLEYFTKSEISDLRSLMSYSKAGPGEAEVGLDLLFRCKNKITGYAHLRCDVPKINRHQLIFVCDKTTIILETSNSITENFTIRIYTEKGLKQLKLKKAAVKADVDERVHEVKKIAQRFVNSCLKRIPMTPSFRDGLRVQELIHKVRPS